MLMDEVNEQGGQEQTEKSEDAIINIGYDPVMQTAKIGRASCRERV
jgi:hypothetical protein